MDPMDRTRLLCPWDFPGKNTGLSCYFLLQGIFQTQGSNPGLLHWQADSWSLSHQGSPKSPLFSNMFARGALWIQSLQKVHKQDLERNTLSCCWIKHVLKCGNMSSLEPESSQVWESLWALCSLPVASKQSVPQGRWWPVFNSPGIET